MKLKVTQERLAQALTLTSRVATTRSALPVLANVLLRAENNQLFVTATNLEIAITHTVAGKIESAGALTVPSRLFTDYITSLPSDSVELEQEGNKLHVISGSYKSTINGVAAEEFPTLPTLKSAQTFAVPAAELKTALQQTILAASHDETRPVLTGAFFHTHDGKVYIAATDSYRLAQKQLPTKIESEFSLITPASALNDVLRIIGDGVGGEVGVSYDDTQVQFLYGDNQLITRQIDGTFPAYRQLIPDKSDTTLTLAKSELLSVTKIASLFARESAGSITLEASEEEQKLRIASVASQVGENTSEAAAKVKGSGKVTLNSRYLIEALNVIEGDQVKFRFSGKISPCVLEPVTKSPDYMHIIMPLKS